MWLGQLYRGQLGATWADLLTQIWGYVVWQTDYQYESRIYKRPAKQQQIFIPPNSLNTWIIKLKINVVFLQ